MFNNVKKYLDIEDFLPESRDAISDYICPICKGVFNQPLIDQCGHIYCSSCIEMTSCCPVTLAPFTESKLAPINFISSVLSKQFLYCKNKKKNCEWYGKLSELNNHISTDCQKQSMSCCFEGCFALVDREGLLDHEEVCEYRIVKCPECSIPIARLNLETHYEVCPNFKLDCPNNCEGKVERKDLNTHLDSECMNRLVNCDYSEIGCQEKPQYKDLTSHLESKMLHHNFLMMKYVLTSHKDLIELKDIINDSADKISELESNLSSLTNTLLDNKGSGNLLINY